MNPKFSRYPLIFFVFGFIGFFGLMGFSFPSFTKKVSVAYVANGANNNIQAIDLETGENLRKVYAGSAPWRLVPSPDGKQLWAQHWYSGTTAVIDLDSHRIIETLHFRGPGVFTTKGEKFLTMSWPGTGLHMIEAKTFKKSEERLIDVNQVYDLSPDPSGEKIYMVQFDPVNKGPRERYGYMLSYPIGEKDPGKAVPLSYRTGRSPVQILASKKNPFLFTADLETSQLTLLNKLGDGRKVPTCQFPRAVLLSKEETRMVVLCWKGQGAKQSRMVRYRINFEKRPWPDITEEAKATLEGGLVAGAFSATGDRVYALDRLHNRLFEINIKNLAIQRSFRTGDDPMDVALLEIPKKVRDRLVKEKDQIRPILKKALDRIRNANKAFNDLSWTEKAEWTETRPGEPPVEGKEGEDSNGIHKTKELKVFFKGPDGMRIENDEDGIRLAKGGSSLSIDPDKKFWINPRQDLIPMVMMLPSLSTEEAVRYLAGDVPGSPYLRSGMAVDQVMEVKEGDHHYFVIGASKKGERVSQLWVDRGTGLPSNLVEQFPVFSGKGHGEGGFGGIVETKFYEYGEIEGGYKIPKRLERVVDGQLIQKVQISDVKINSGLKEASFDLTRLGGIVSEPSEKIVVPVKTNAPQDQPGRFVPSLGNDHIPHPQADHPPYNSNPPTSGHHLPYIADWGIHSVPIPLSLQVHNLEDGGVAVQYNCPEGCPELVRKLERIVKTYDHVLLAPYPLMDHKIALTAWERIDTLNDFDPDRIIRFIEAYEGIDHHVQKAGG